MKNLFTLLALFFTIGLFAQNNVTVKINHKFGANDFAANTQVMCYDDYNVMVTRLQYYINSFVITHDGGQVTEDTSHFLINAEQLTELDLGMFDINNVENISFSIGVHPDKNHLDPTLYPSVHPLAPKNPSMHWGWASGYRFVALEGNVGANMSEIYQVHALGDTNYKTVSMSIGGNLDGTNLTISIDADYLGMYNNMDVSAGVFTHSEENEAAQLLTNFETDVFFPEGEVPTAIIDPVFEGKFLVQPNPSIEKHTNVVLDLPEEGNYKLTLVDVTGRIIQTQTISSADQIVQMKNNHSGVFFIHLWKDGIPVAFEKWIVK